MKHFLDFTIFVIGAGLYVAAVLGQAWALPTLAWLAFYLGFMHIINPYVHN
jgi:hypothetical protein